MLSEDTSIFFLGLSLFLTITFRIGIIGSVTVNPTTGGYSITIGINENVPQPETEAELNSYINKIRLSFQSFTSQLYRSTKGAFFIENIQILLPESWDSSIPAEYLPVNNALTYSKTDIRLDYNVTNPYVSNPTVCGLPGKYMELPANFFTGEAVDDKFGNLGKAFLTQWARFRWGVWEEHGYATGNSKEQFPYFYSESPIDSEEIEWKTTGCSDIELTGNYTNTTGQPCIAPDENCRFRPSPTNTATTSLMGFHWLQNVEHFCDSETHNRRAPNKQNQFCNYKSIWEVIRKSPDFTVHGPLEIVPRPNLSVVRINKYPVLHLILDRGFIENEDGVAIMNSIIHQIGNFLGSLTRNQLAKVSVYQSTGVSTLVPWMNLDGNLDTFLEAIGKVNTNHPGFRDFSSALKNAADDLEDLQPSGGAIVFMIKTGAAETYFHHYQSEEEILASFYQTKTRFFAAEIKTSTNYPLVHLNRLTQYTGGAHVEFNNRITAPEQILALTNVISNISNSQSTIEDSRTQVIYKGLIAESETRTGISWSGLTNVRAHLSALNGIEPYNLTTEAVKVLTRNEWDEALDVTRRTVHTYELPDSGAFVTFGFNCENCTDRIAHLIIVGEKASGQEESDVSIEVQTSANTEHVFDFGLVPDQDLEPFAIYAEVKYQRTQIPININVNAIVTDSAGNEQLIPMKDNGILPDNQEFDGVFSGYYIPPVDGTYKIAITITTTDLVAGSTDSNIENVANVNNNVQPRLLPIDQEQIGCSDEECATVNLDSYANVIYLPSVTFRNVVNFVKRPARILDFVAKLTSGPTLVFEFRSPAIIGNTTAKANYYTIFGSNNKEDLIDDSDNRQEVLRTQSVSAAESLQSISEVVTSSTRFEFYAVYATYGAIPNQKHEKSNIAKVVIDASVGEPSPGEDDPFFKTAGGIVVIVLIALIAVGVVGGGAFFYMKKKRSSQSSKFSTFP